jgi:two-component system sensor histidine kinase VicK
VVEEMEPQLLAKKQTYAQKIAVKLPKINVDYQLMRMVLQNLLSNAVKYTPDKGAIKVSLTAEKATSVVAGVTLPVDSLLITVADNGYGIPEKQQDKIFTKLFRADNILTHDTTGTGFGLYIVKSICETSGGCIWFTSEENKGTTFYVSIPMSGMKKREGTRSLA